MSYLITYTGVSAFMELRGIIEEASRETNLTNQNTENTWEKYQA